MKTEKGSTLLMTICLITFLFLLLGALLPMMANEVRASGYNTNYLVAKAAADGAAYYEIQRVQTILNQGLIPTIANINVTREKQNISTPSSAKVEWTCILDSANNVIQIMAIGTYKTVNANSSVNIYLRNSPIIIPGGGVLDMVYTATYSHNDHNPLSSSDKEVRWKIETGADGTKYSKQSDVSQIMFNDAATRDTIKFSYRANAAIVGDTSNGGGYGIYYGMIGNADNMNAYVLQFDPGAYRDNSTGFNAETTYDSRGHIVKQGGALLVKKVIFAPGITDPGDTNNSGFTKNTNSSPGLQEFNDSPEDPDRAGENIQDSGNNSDYWARPFQIADTTIGEVMRVPLSSDYDYMGTSLQTLMKDYYNSIGSSATFNLFTAHTFTIETKMDGDHMWHYIYCDNNPEAILKFYDHSTSLAAGYKLTSFKGTHTGLRVWNNSVQTNFVNESDSTSSQPVFQSIVWIK